MLVPSRRRLRIEVRIVLGLSLGQSAVYSVVQLLGQDDPGAARAGHVHAEPLAKYTGILRLTYQLLDIIFALVPVLLVIYFLTEHRQTKAGRAIWVALHSRSWVSISPAPEGTCCRASGWPL